jgi:hypothetical protein
MQLSLWSAVSQAWHSVVALGSARLQCYVEDLELEQEQHPSCLHFVSQQADLQMVQESHSKASQV